MYKIIKEFNINNLIYKLGYTLYDNKVYPRIEIYKDEKLLSGGCWSDGAYACLFNFVVSNSSSITYSNISTIKEMFTKLRKYNEIPEYIEKEYEKIFLLYKLNDFNEL